MHIRKHILMAPVAILTLASQAAADPVFVTSGFIQTYGNGSSFVFSTEDGRSFTGDTEGLGTLPLFISGRSGDVVNLSSAINTELTGFSIYDPARHDLAARASFTFRASDAVLPGADAVQAAPNGLGLLAAPFTFTGSLWVYSTYAALSAGGPPEWQYNLFGSGVADAMLMTSMTPDGQPILSYSGVYTFAADPSAPVPEPGTLLLFGSGAAALAARRRETLRR
jgi:hypothetical protein